MIFLVLVLCVATVASGCGVPPIAPNPNTLIVGGTEAKSGSWPWQANLRSKSSNYQFCGGTLIHPQFVLTAGHCYYRDSNTDNEVGLGFHHKNGGETGSVRVGVKAIHMHPGYKDRTLENDICLLQLDNPVTLNDRIQLACLPSNDVGFVNQVWITGWGDNEKIIQPTYLQQAMVETIPTSTCNARDWYNGEIVDGMFCAGYAAGEIDTCQGDSGGPLVQNEGGKYTVYGVTSWGYGCADAKNPGVYADVYKYISWINCKLANPTANCV